MSSRASPPDQDPRQRLLQLADACVLCGLCLPHCPTYRLDETESESPRGRVMLAKMLARSGDALDASAGLALDHCLACGRCEQACPAKVRFGEMLTLTRSLQVRSPPTAAQRAALWASRNPQLFSLLARVARPLKRLAPAALRGALSRAARPVDTRAPKLMPLEATALPSPGARDASPPALRLGLLVGCVARSLDAPAQRAAVQLLAASGHQVVAPVAQGCCGALALHAGDARLAARQQDHNREVWSAIRPDALLGTASGCQAAFRAGLESIVPVQDIFEFLDADPKLASLRLRALPQRVLLHLPCTLRDSPAAVAGLRSLLARVPELHVQELPDSGCCGAAGLHVLQFPRRANALRAPLAAAAARLGAATLLSSNIGCAMHLEAAAELAGIRIRHPLELLAEALP